MIGFAVSCLTATFECIAQQADNSPYEPIGPGAARRTEHLTSGPLQVSIVRVDLTNPRITIDAEPGENAMFHGEAVPDVVAREAASTTSRVIAAVNADFWSMSPRPYTPLGFLVADNFICDFPHPERSVFALGKDRKPFIGRVHLDVSVKTDSVSLRVSSINDTRATNSVTLFTPPLGAVVPPTKGRRYVLTLSQPELLPNSTVRAQISGVPSETSTPLKENTLVLSLPPGSKSVLHDGDTCIISAHVPEINGVVSTCIGGGPRLLKSGNVQVSYEEEHMGRSFAYDKHPRTAVGFTADKKTMYLVAVDGRQPKLSVGMNLFELAEYMRQLGCAEAMNLDGGGSTTMVAGGELLNHPSDLKGPRSVMNSLVVFAEPGSGKPRKLLFEPNGDPLVVPAGTTLQLRVRGYDETDTPVNLDSGGVLQASVSNIAKHTKASGDTITLETDEQPASGKVQAEIDNVHGEINVSTVHLSGLRVSPSPLLLDPGETEELEVSTAAADANVIVQPQMITMRPGDGSLTTSGTLVQGNQKGRGVLTVSIGQTKAPVHYFVDESSRTLLASFDDAARHLGITGLHFAGDKTAVQSSTDTKKEGGAALAVQYAMNGSGRSRINVPVGALLNRAPAKFGVWIYGDGKQAWLRANLIDARGTTFTADFTEGGKGIYWSGEWRRKSCLFKDLVPEGASSSAKPQFPLTLKDVYIAQDQEALKATGRIIIDALEAEYPPVSSTPAAAK